MEPEDFKQAWQAPTSQSRLNIDPDLLLQEVRSKQHNFERMIFWRDVREVGTGLVLIPIWIGMGWKLTMPWTWWLTLPGLFWIVGFMLVDRWRQRSRPNESGAPLRQYVEYSVAQVEHQIWLLSHVLWWYLLPLGLPLFAFILQGAWENRSDGWLTALTLVVVIVVVGAVYAFIYWLNLKAVSASLSPRRQELQTLLEALKDESSTSSP